jgi:ubiquinone/menaquinone biosynthesis C-methylase UbiE
MLQFDSREFWQRRTWDRDQAVANAPPFVREAWLRQETYTLEALEGIIARMTRPCRIADVPCGSGRISALILSRFGPRVRMTGVDVNRNSLVVARNRVGRVPQWSAVCADAYDVGAIHAGAFDVAVSLDFLHHISDMRRMLLAFRRCLADGGHFIGNSMAAEQYTEWDRAKYGWIKSACRRHGYRLAAAAHRHVPTVRPLIRNAGLARIEALKRDELGGHLDGLFEVVDMRSDHYHWMAAVAR